MKSILTLASALALPMLLLPGCSESAAEKEAHQVALAAKIEGLVELPEGAGPIESYGRNYQIEGNGSVRGFYTSHPIPDHAKLGEIRWLESSDEFLTVLDGGCDYIAVTYNPNSEHVSAECSGVQ